MSEYREIMEQISCSISKDANFPISTSDELLAAFPCGEDTTIKVGEKEVKVGEAVKKLNSSHYPFICSDDITNAICEIWDTDILI